MIYLIAISLGKPLVTFYRKVEVLPILPVGSYVYPVDGWDGFEIAYYSFSLNEQPNNTICHLEEVRDLLLDEDIMCDGETVEQVLRKSGFVSREEWINR